MSQELTRTHLAGRLAAAILVGFSTTLACVAATTEQGQAKTAEVHPLTTPGPSPAPPEADPLAAKDDAGSPDASDGGCPHGALEDPHRGFVRCLAPGEKSPIVTGDPDAGDGSAPEGGAPKDAGPGETADAGAAPSNDGGADTGDAGVDAGPAPVVPGPPPLVEMKPLKFDNGEVPKAEKALSGAKVLEAIAKCVGDAGGLTAKTGSLKVEILVRAQGKAEGVEVTAQGASKEAAKCVRTLLKNKTLGTPTADPVGVTVVYSLKPAGK